MKHFTVSNKIRKMLISAWGVIWVCFMLLLLAGGILDATGNLRATYKDGAYFAYGWNGKEHISPVQFERIEYIRAYYIIFLSISGFLGVLSLTLCKITVTPPPREELKP